MHQSHHLPKPLHSLSGTELNELVEQRVLDLPFPDPPAIRHAAELPEFFHTLLSVIERLDWEWSMRCYYDENADRIYCFEVAVRVVSFGNHPHLHDYSSCSNESYMHAGCVAFLLATEKEYAYLSQVPFSIDETHE